MKASRMGVELKGKRTQPASHPVALLSDYQKDPDAQTTPVSSQILKKAAKEKIQLEGRLQRAFRRSLGSVQLSSTDSAGEHGTSSEELDVLGGRTAASDQHAREMDCAETEGAIDLSCNSP
jgi:hypothetical protein